MSQTTQHKPTPVDTLAAQNTFMLHDNYINNLHQNTHNIAEQQQQLQPKIQPKKRWKLTDKMALVKSIKMYLTIFVATTCIYMVLYQYHISRQPLPAPEIIKNKDIISAAALLNENNNSNNNKYKYNIIQETAATTTTTSLLRKSYKLLLWSPISLFNTPTQQQQQQQQQQSNSVKQSSTATAIQNQTKSVGPVSDIGRHHQAPLQNSSNDVVDVASPAPLSAPSAAAAAAAAQTHSSTLFASLITSTSSSTSTSASASSLNTTTTNTNTMTTSTTSIAHNNHNKTSNTNLLAAKHSSVLAQSNHSHVNTSQHIKPIAAASLTKQHLQQQPRNAGSHVSASTNHSKLAATNKTHSLTSLPLIATIIGVNSKLTSKLRPASASLKATKNTNTTIEHASHAALKVAPPIAASLPPPLYIITPTYRRPEQLAELTRLGYTLKHVVNMLWLVIEDANRTSPLVTQTLNRIGVPFEYFVAPMPEEYKKTKKAKPRGVSNRNRGIEWLRANATEGVFYFADDDNTYDISIFEQMRYTKKVAMWPVGLVTKFGVSSPIIRNGKIDGFYDGWIGGRKFPVDMAGFAVSVEFLHARPKAKMPFKPGYEEDGFLKSLSPLNLTEIELLADNCTEILTWHTQTKKNGAAEALNMTKYGNTNLVSIDKLLVRP